MTNVPKIATNVLAIAVGIDQCLAVVGDGTAPSLIGPIAYETRVNYGDFFPLSGRAVGDQPLEFEWLANGVPIGTQTNAFPQIPATPSAGGVSYQLVVSNPFGSTTSSVAQVSFNPVNAFGSSEDGQQSAPDATTNCLAVAAGGFHSLFLNPDGTVGAWGKDNDGQTEVPLTASNVVAVAAGGDHSPAVAHRGVVIWGGGE